MLQELHIHTTYCDGRSSVEELVQAAIAKGYSRLGFSGHSFTAFDTSWCMSREGSAQYRAEVRAAAEKYRDKIEILCGTEQDYWSGESTEPYDYVIGSVHYLKQGDEYFPIDESPELVRSAADRLFGGDVLSLAELYFETAGCVVEKTGCDCIGHFDVIAKFTDISPLFDERSERYRSAWRKAADRLLESGKPFEINTRAMLSGYRKVPYPAPEIFEYLRANGASFILSSDCHDARELGFGFDEVRQMYGL